MENLQIERRTVKDTDIFIGSKIIKEIKKLCKKFKVSVSFGYFELFDSVSCGHDGHSCSCHTICHT